MFGEIYKWNYDYVRLACDSGFSFEKYKTDCFDKNKICLIDIDRIIQEKDVATIEKLIPSINQFVLDPEQAQILDNHFVKIFRLSQLSIEYLLFCKKHLDHTLVQVREELKKTKEENQELNLFVGDLKNHISVLMKEIKEKNTVTSFKCEYCNKAFSTAEFLDSHVKRRHSTQTNSLEKETDKLHFEIKELKGRLNSAEKLIQNQPKPSSETEPQVLKENELRKINELQQKFEDLRIQVQSELKILQTQFNFQTYEEKYEKLFQQMNLQKLPISENVGKLLSKTESLKEKKETDTQTDISFQDVVKQSDYVKLDVKSKENISEFVNRKEQITEFGEALEIRVTSSLDKIEKQMESFWNKLKEMEVNKKTSVKSELEKSQALYSIKPRSKFTINKGPLEKERKVADDMQHNLVNVHNKFEIQKHIRERNDKEEAIKVKQKEDNKSEPVCIVQPIEQKTTYLHSSLRGVDFNKKKVSSAPASPSDTETEVSDGFKRYKKTQPQHLHSHEKQSLLTSTTKPKVDTELFNDFKEEVETIMVMGRLQDLGISPEWKGIPTHSFQRALEIVNHQGNLMKKMYPDFETILSHIEKSIDKTYESEIRNKNIKKNQQKPVKDQNKFSLVGYSKKEKVTPQIEMKNKKMYETDSESEPAKVMDNLRQFSAPYSAVIEELKSTAKLKCTNNNSASETNSFKEENVTQETKGVLRNYPSLGSLVKKKVIFDLKDNEGNEILNEKDNGSTISVTSSIFDGSPKQTKPNKNSKQKDIENLSDFDFSDL